ncbi:MAG: GNAT family N-acetyltransferase [Betaproteobacteria bacterium]|nr:GNAT family N-acetyltransferase [Betaproteobacteria bacterium]
MLTSGLSIEWTRQPDEIRLAQALRFKVFSEDFSPVFPHAQEGLDKDPFDDVCDHLLIKEKATQLVVGTYRVISPTAACLIGHAYCESIFDLSPLALLKSKVVEIDRSCIDKRYRNGSTILLMWKRIYQYMLTHQYEYIMGCSSVSLTDKGPAAAGLLHKLVSQGHYSTEHQFHAKSPVDLTGITPSKNVSVPAILKGYLSVGAKVCSEPGFDPLFNSADFLTILKLSDMNQLFVQRFSR